MGYDNLICSPGQLTSPFIIDFNPSPTCTVHRVSFIQQGFFPANNQNLQVLFLKLKEGIAASSVESLVTHASALQDLQLRS